MDQLFNSSEKRLSASAFVTRPLREKRQVGRVTLENKSYTLKESAGDVALPLRIAY